LLSLRAPRLFAASACVFLHLRRAPTGALGALWLQGGQLGRIVCVQALRPVRMPAYIRGIQSLMQRPEWAGMPLLASSMRFKVAIRASLTRVHLLPCLIKVELSPSVDV